MPIIDQHQPGDFCWFELGTTDPDAATTFYQGLFGWEVAKFPMGPGEFYYMPKKHGKDVAGMYKLGAQEAGMPPTWKLYVQVLNADEAAAKITAAGGKVVAGPFDVMTFGRMCVFQDPEGVFQCVWQPMSHKGSLVVGEAGTIGWGELATRDSAGAKQFYTTVFGWGVKHDDKTGYSEWQNGGRSIGGMMQMDEKWGNIPAHWALYIMTDDCDATVAKAKELGGALVHGPHDIPNVGRFALIRDPQGAHFYTIKLTHHTHL
ncbi:MAG: VOC family protein [Bryobacteraceae bacterium]